MDYKFSGFRLETRTSTLFFQDETLKLRPKSFEVMLYLIENRDHVVSKQDLMANIWNDVYVDDHVIFQSVAEIRSVVDNKNCIVTYSRKGYQWVTPIDAVENVTGQVPRRPKQSLLMSLRLKFSLWLWAAVAASFFVSIGIFFLSLKPEPRFPISPGTIAILPIANELDEGQHAWLRLGGMDLVNHQLDGTNLRIFPSAEVLVALKNAEVTSIKEPDQLAYRLRTQMGVNTVVHIRVLDAPMGYQAHFVLMHKNALVRGIAFNDSLPELVKSVAEKIAYKFNKEAHIETSEYNNTFTEETFLKGLEHFMREEYALAEPFLKSAYLMNPDNINVQIFLIQNYIVLKKLDIAERYLKELQVNDDKKKQLYSKSLLAQIAGRRGSHNESLSLLKSSYSFSDSFGDKLYVAMSYLELARYSSKLQDVSHAKPYFDTALRLQESFGCGYGLVGVLSEYSKLWLRLEEYNQAESLLKRALLTADKFKLKQSKVLILLSLADIYVSQKINQKAIETAKSARDYANELGNKKMIKLVNEWFERYETVEAPLYSKQHSR